MPQGQMMPQQAFPPQGFAQGRPPQQKQPPAAHAQAIRDPLPPPPPTGEIKLPTSPRTVRGVMPPPATASVGTSRPLATAAVAVAIPTPEELGLTPSSRPAPQVRGVAAELDWARARRQMQELGVVRFQWEQLPGGGARFSCWLSSGAATPIQGEGRNEAEAVSQCLERARYQLARNR